MGSDVGSLIGEHLECNVTAGSIALTADLGKQLRGKLVLARMAVSGDRSGEAFLVTGVKTAIALGGRLIMLPTEELAVRVNNQNFDGELADAFEEITNIVTGSLNALFQEAATLKLHYKKLEVKQAAFPPGPATVLPDFSESCYYLASVATRSGGQDLGPFWLIFPPTILDLPLPEAATAATTATGKGPDNPTAGAETSPSGGGKPPLVLIVAEEVADGARIADCLKRNNIQAMEVEIQGDHRKALADREFGGVLLLMREVGELGFATTIKLRSAMKPATPLIIAGPEWTRKAVLQAIKYGVSDILISPVSDQDLLDKLRKHLR